MLCEQGYGGCLYYSFLSSMYFMLDMGKFLGVGNDSNDLNMPGLRFNRQHGIGALTGANNQGRLTINFCQLHTRVLLVTSA